MRDKGFSRLMTAIFGIFLFSSFSNALDKCREVKKNDLPKQLKQVCGAKHPNGMNRAVWISEDKIAIECIFFSYTPTYSYLLAEKNKDLWSTQKLSLKEITKKDCFKH